MSETLFGRLAGQDQVGFAELWQIWPRKVDKGHARMAYRRAIKKIDRAAILAGAKAYAATRAGQDQKYTVHLATWLNGERWADEQPAPPVPSDDVIRQVERRKVMTEPDPGVTAAERGEVARLMGDLVRDLKQKTG